MKKVEAIVRSSMLEPLKEALFRSGVGGLTVSEVMGCGSQHGWSEYVRGSEVLVTMLPKIKFDLVVADDEVESVVELIRKTAYTGEVGDGKIFVMPVEQVIRIRTGESGEAAV